ncbi:DNA polymerase III subunit delta' [Piscirickettsia salmonis]|uniref:DNA-directed DNA polymerase n=1 Tax=Piscirickettsia salmonis TaxID=1238 RepID=A0A1L6TGI7_PISSA|nr:DNA polymerase III subunit delta' [Piscirickettsia salmonis]AKP72880.2 DNA polymerase III subunit delta' [Piscirickettsia salmonis LF-89 = ATCC VR-1361]ALB21499.1 DNA polymerase III, delta prime subunit [Piscirickettsia salmonis]ALY01719.1 DNA polymerase III subunit delta' [Piscirickettsia salmonis]AMA41235.1 DNA polymerase III subunit delta' [Piscirickettsia salmonis]AOS36424.1 DNA polymerase III subunit delta' [Piscirickettsia salmonis]
MNQSLYPWHYKAWQQLVQAGQAKSMPHAVLLHGPSQTGKLSFARHLTAFLLCQQPQPQGACGGCQSCLLYQAGSHPDCTELVGESNGVIKVDQIRALITSLHTARHQLGYRVILVNHAECMNNAAANSFLKTLEEPPEHTVILLISSQPGRLLPTIRSRCQQISLLPAKTEVLAWLQQQNTSLTMIEAARRYQLLGHAPLKLLDEAYIADYSQQIDLWLNVLEGRQTVHYGCKPSYLLKQLVDWSRLCSWLLKAALGQLFEGDEKLSQRLITLAGRIQPQALLIFYQQLQQSIQQLAAHNSLNEAVLLDGHWVSWQRLARV